MRKTKKMLKIEGRIEEPIEEFLKREYLENKKTIYDIGEYLKIHFSTVSDWLKKFDIKIIDCRDRRGVIKPPRDQLIKWYHKDKRSIIEIAKIVGVAPGTVYNWLKNDGIEIRSMSETKRKGRYRPSNSKLYELYHKKGLTLIEIGGGMVMTIL